MMSENLIEITVLNWERHNPRKDGRKYHWFKLQNDALWDEKLINCTPHDRLVWVSILCLASRVNSAHVSMHSVFIARALRSRAYDVCKSVHALCKSGVISTSFTFTNDEQGRLDKIRDENREEKIIHAQPDGRASVSRVFFDLDKIYQLYPRKLGKTRGLAKLKTAIKTQADYDALTTAVTNYAKASQGTESQFVKHFSTWVSEWRDWITPDQPDAKTAQQSRTEMLRQYILNKEKEDADRKNKTGVGTLAERGRTIGAEFWQEDAAGTDVSDLEGDTTF